jgi:hypothetical protein
VDRRKQRNETNCIGTMYSLLHQMRNIDVLSKGLIPASRQDR